MISVLTIGSMFWSIQTNQRDLSNIWHLKIAKILLRHKERLWNVSVGSEQDEDGVVMVIEGDGGWSRVWVPRIIFDNTKATEESILDAKLIIIKIGPSCCGDFAQLFLSVPYPQPSFL